MGKTKVKVIGLSAGHTTIETYMCILAELKGDRKIPIVINTADAQTIALKVEGLKSKRPLTVDLLKSFAERFEITTEYVYIHNILEGVFHAKIVATNIYGQKEEINCTIGDGIASALTFNVPIYVDDKVMDLASVRTDENGMVLNEDDSPMSAKGVSETEVVKKKTKVLSKEELEKRLSEALQNEDYELAAQIRDRLNSI